MGTSEFLPIMVQNGVGLSKFSVTSSELQKSAVLAVYPTRMKIAYTTTVIFWQMMNTDGNLNLHVKKVKFKYKFTGYHYMAKFMFKTETCKPVTIRT